MKKKRIMMTPTNMEYLGIKKEVTKGTVTRLGKVKKVHYMWSDRIRKFFGLPIKHGIMIEI
jgi:hypothetical protein